MPIYEYLCEKCELEFEREQRISDEPVKTCPDCRARKVKRLISQTSFVLKGSGWHSDLYSSSKRDTKSAAGGDESSEKSSEAKSSESKTDGDKSGGDKSGGDKTDGDKGGGDKAKKKGDKAGKKSAA